MRLSLRFPFGGRSSRPRWGVRAREEPVAECGLNDGRPRSGAGRPAAARTAPSGERRYSCRLASTGLPASAALTFAQRAPVALPAGFARFGARGLLLPSDSRDPSAGDAEREIVVAHGLGPLLAEGEVGMVLRSSQWPRRAPPSCGFPDCGGVALEGRPRLAGEHVAVVVETESRSIRRSRRRASPGCGAPPTRRARRLRRGLGGRRVLLRFPAARARHSAARPPAAPSFPTV